MRIGFLTSEYPHSRVAHGGGIGTSIKNLSIGLVSLNVDVTVFVIGQDCDETFDDEGVLVVKISNGNIPLFRRWFDAKKRS